MDIFIKNSEVSRNIFSPGDSQSKLVKKARQFNYHSPLSKYEKLVHLGIKGTKSLRSLQSKRLRRCRRSHKNSSKTLFTEEISDSQNLQLTQECPITVNSLLMSKSTTENEEYLNSQKKTLIEDTKTKEAIQTDKLHYLSNDKNKKENEFESSKPKCYNNMPDTLVSIANESYGTNQELPMHLSRKCSHELRENKTTEGNISSAYPAIVPNINKNILLFKNYSFQELSVNSTPARNLIPLNNDKHNILNISSALQHLPVKLIPCNISTALVQEKPIYIAELDQNNAQIIKKQEIQSATKSKTVSLEQEKSAKPEDILRCSEVKPQNYNDSVCLGQVIDLNTSKISKQKNMCITLDRSKSLEPNLNEIENSPTIINKFNENFQKNVKNALKMYSSTTWNTTSRSSFWEMESNSSGEINTSEIATYKLNSKEEDNSHHKNNEANQVMLHDETCISSKVDSFRDYRNSDNMSRTCIIKNFNNVVDPNSPECILKTKEVDKTLPHERNSKADGDWENSETNSEYSSIGRYSSPMSLDETIFDEIRHADNGQNLELCDIESCSSTVAYSNSESDIFSSVSKVNNNKFNDEYPQSQNDKSETFSHCEDYFSKINGCIPNSTLKMAQEINKDDISERTQTWVNSTNKIISMNTIREGNRKENCRENIKESDTSHGIQNVFTDEKQVNCFGKTSSQTTCFSAANNVKGDDMSTQSHQSSVEGKRHNYCLRMSEMIDICTKCLVDVVTNPSNEVLLNLLNKRFNEILSSEHNKDSTIFSLISACTLLLNNAQEKIDNVCPFPQQSIIREMIQILHQQALFVSEMWYKAEKLGTDDTTLNSTSQKDINNEKHTKKSETKMKETLNIPKHMFELENNSIQDDFKIHICQSTSTNVISSCNDNINAELHQPQNILSLSNCECSRKKTSESTFKETPNCIEQEKKDVCTTDANPNSKSESNIPTQYVKIKRMSNELQANNASPTKCKKINEKIFSQRHVDKQSYFSSIKSNIYCKSKYGTNVTLENLSSSDKNKQMDPNQAAVKDKNIHHKYHKNCTKDAKENIIRKKDTQENGKKEIVQEARKMLPCSISLQKNKDSIVRVQSYKTKKVCEEAKEQSTHRQNIITIKTLLGDEGKAHPDIAAKERHVDEALLGKSHTAYLKPKYKNHDKFQWKKSLNKHIGQFEKDWTVKSTIGKIDENFPLPKECLSIHENYNYLRSDEVFKSDDHIQMSRKNESDLLKKTLNENSSHENLTTMDGASYKCISESSDEEISVTNLCEGFDKEMLQISASQFPKKDSGLSVKSMIDSAITHSLPSLKITKRKDRKGQKNIFPANRQRETHGSLSRGSSTGSRPKSNAPKVVEAEKRSSRTKTVEQRPRSKTPGAHSDNSVGHPQRRAFVYKLECMKVLDRVYNHPSSVHFRHEVKSKDVPDYYVVIKRGMCFDMIAYKLRNNIYSELHEFLSDMNLVFNNCRFYHKPESAYFKAGEKVHKYYTELLRRTFEPCDGQH